MARPHKKGLDYFPFNVTFFNDKKLRLIKSEFGAKGEIIAIRLLCAIYNDEGYYYKWGEEECLLLAEEAGAEFVPNLVNEIVAGLVRRGFFDKTVFDSFGVLTSHGIQKRYQEATEKRTINSINPDYYVPSEDEKNELKNNMNYENKLTKNVNSEKTIVNDEITTVNSEKTPVNSKFSTQRKEKKRREKNKEKIYKKENSNFSISASVFKPPKSDEVQQYAESINFFFNAEEFISYYDAVGWKMGEKLKPMEDWKAAVRYWKQNGVQNGTNNGVQKREPATAKSIDDKSKKLWDELGLESQGIGGGA